MKSFPRLRTLASAVPCVAARFAAEPGVTESGSKSGSEMDAAAGLLQPARGYVRSTDRRWFFPQSAALDEYGRR